jgi:hypothetical protein
MPRVVISGQAARRFTGGVIELEVEANNFRRMVLELDRRLPGLGRQIDESMRWRSTVRSSGTPASSPLTATAKYS